MKSLQEAIDDAMRDIVALRQAIKVLQKMEEEKVDYVKTMQELMGQVEKK